MAAPHEATQRHLAEIGLRAGGPYGFALGGGHAIAAHGILTRSSEDVDLFADWLCDFAEYGTTQDQITQLRTRVARWHAELTG